MERLRILGLDPGTQKYGYAILDTALPRPLYVEAGTLVASGHDRKKRLMTLGSDLRALLIEFRPDSLHIETAFWAGHASAAGALGEIRGITLWLAAEARIPVRDWTPKQVRATIGLGGGARKSQVPGWVRQVLEMQRDPESDAADALAVALAGAFSG